MVKPPFVHFYIIPRILLRKMPFKYPWDNFIYIGMYIKYKGNKPLHGIVAAIKKKE
jgi:hypothetical protein